MIRRHARERQREWAVRGETNGRRLQNFAQQDRDQVLLSNGPPPAFEDNIHDFLFCIF